MKRARQRLAPTQSVSDATWLNERQVAEPSGRTFRGWRGQDAYDCSAPLHEGKIPILDGF